LRLTASLVGAGIIEADIGRMATYLAAATLAFVLLTFGIRRLIQRKSQNSGSV